jgi:tellurite methyltransferase
MMKYMSTPVTDFSRPTPFLVEHIRNLHRGKALDIGAGSGRNALYLAKEGFDVTALDSDDTALKTLSTTAKNEGLTITTCLKDIRSFESTEKYDLIVCLMVLHFFDPKDIQYVIEWMKDHTYEGGVNIVSAFTDRNPVGTRPHLFKTDELEGFYANWQSMSHELAESSIVEDRKLLTYSVVRIAAVKET